MGRIFHKEGTFRRSLNFSYSRKHETAARNGSSAYFGWRANNVNLIHRSKVDTFGWNERSNLRQVQDHGSLLLEKILVRKIKWTRLESSYPQKEGLSASVGTGNHENAISGVVISTDCCRAGNKLIDNEFEHQMPSIHYVQKACITFNWLGLDQMKFLTETCEAHQPK